MTTPQRFFVVDTMAMAWRSYHAFGQRPLTTSQGLPVSAVYGTALLMMGLLEDEKPDFLAAATDLKEKTFRHEMYPEYKANRDEPPEDFVVQIPYLYRFFDAMGLTLLKRPGVEADDLIASMVKRFAADDLSCYIVSGDKDFLQLVDGRVFLYSPKKNEPAQIVGREGTFEKWGCHPEQIVDLLSIMGDSSDNVPGVTGIGEKGAAALIARFGNLDNIYAHVDEITNNRQRESLKRDRDSAYLSRALVTLKTDVDIPFSLEDMRCDPLRMLSRPELIELARELEFKSIAAKLSEYATKAKALEVRTIDETVTRGDSLDYHCANTPELLADALAELARAPVFSFDSETTGLDIISDRPIGLSFSTGEGSGFYIPVVERHLKGLTPAEVVARLRPVFADPTKTKVAHNLKFDLQMLANIGIAVAPTLGDTMLMSWILDSTAREHNLDACALRHFNYQKIPTSRLIGDKGERSMLDCDLSLLTAYAVEDADFTWRLYDLFARRLSETGLTQVYETIDLPLVPVLADMERNGVWVDPTVLGDLSTSLGAESESLTRAIHEMAGEEFNIASPKQLGVILFEKLKIHEALGIKRLKKTQSGYSTDVSVLEKMSEHPLPRAILEYRNVTKLKGTYVDVLPQLMSDVTGRVHTHFHQTGTATGRLSSSDPNLQNIPIRTPRGRAIRRAFRPQEDGWVTISADYSQIELRLLAHLSGDEALIRAFADGADIHRATAARVFGVDPADVTDEQRSQAKAINFGIIYGMGPQRLAAETGVSLDDARVFIDKYFAGYPRIREYIDRCVASAKAKGYAETITGRRRPIPEIHSPNRGDAVGAENIAVNSPVQGSASDLIKVAMVSIHKALRERALEARLLLQVHDELVLECATGHLEEVTRLVRECMEGAMDLSVPLTVEIGSGANWLEAH